MSKPELPLGALLMDAVEVLDPLFSAAEGIKAQLEERGWSPSAAEDIAKNWLIFAIDSAWRKA